MRRYFPLGAVLFVVVVGHLSLFPKVADLDGFYHLGHAAAYLEGSLFDSSLPWATQSVIRDQGADMWWGFHVLLTPFAAIGAADDGIRTAAFFLTLLLAGTFNWVLRRHRVEGSLWWTALFLIAIPNLFLRHLMVRPHLVSLGASIALLSVLVRGRWWQAALLSALITWVHLSLFWMAPGIVAAYTLVWAARRLLHGPEETDGIAPAAAIPAVFLGSVAGWLLRPNPIGAGILANVQIVRLFAQKATEEPLLFAPELQPASLLEITLTSWLFLGSWLLALGALAWFAYKGRWSDLEREERTLLVCATVISIPFFLLALFSAKRAMVQWTAFGFLLFPFVWTALVRPETKRLLKSLVLLLLTTHVAWGAHRHRLNMEFVAFDPHTMRGLAEYLEQNAEPGEVVFHTRWDNFGPLFAWSRTPHYIGGMDPIFQFTHSPRRYWEFFYLSADVNVEYTCDAFPCANGSITETHEALREHFAARWVVTEPRRNPRFTLYLLNDPRYELVAETQHEALFEILDAPSGGQ